MIYLVLYLVCCTVLSILLIISISKGEGITGREMLQSAFVIFTPVLNMVGLTVIVFFSLDEFMEKHDILNKAYFIRETK